MTQIPLPEQAEQLFRPGRVDFVYRYGHDTCCAEVFFSDGVDWWLFFPSNLGGDTLMALIAALVRMVSYDEAEASACRWEEPGQTFWVLHRDADSLHITVLTHSIFNRSSTEPAGKVVLETTVDFWEFAQRVRLAASRVSTMLVGEEQRRVILTDDPGYTALSSYLAQHRMSPHRNVAN